ncbi:MAG: hypothetical protein OQK78_00840 [Gammaproteobacteria bacterium]|nr:hypothetical protein [Gammaproteobacteria bacterium]
MNKIVALSIIAGLAVLMQGCGAQNVKLSQQDREGLKNLNTITVVHQSAGWPSFKTPAGVLASELTLGLSEDWSAGQKMVHKYKIEDPSQKIQNKFLKQLNNGSKVANFSTIKKPLGYKEGTIEKLKEKYKEGVVLKFHNHWWQIWYYPTNWGRYQMWFQANAELVRLDDSKVLWKSVCKADQKNSKTAPTLDELTAENSKVLEKWVEDATTQCSDQLVKDFYGNI